MAGVTRVVITRVPGLRIPYRHYLQRLLPHAEWVEDRTRDAFETFRRAMALPGAAPCIHLEDDVVLTQGFTALAEAAIAAQPTVVQQFFSMRGADRTVGSRWDDKFVGNLAWYVPEGWAPRLLAYYPDWVAHWRHRTPTRTPPTWKVGYDNFVNDFLRKEQTKYWIVCPNLVDHRRGVSAIDPRRSSTSRVSRTFRDPAP